MARRRMFNLDIIDTDLFIEMPQSSRLLYYELCMRADDDGFVSSPKKIQRVVGCSDDDFKVLITKKLDINRRPEYLMSQCVKNDKICYSDNLTGSDFLHVIDRFKLV